MTGDASPLAVRLAQWVADLAFDDLPIAVVEKAKLAILDQIGVQLRGATLPNVVPELRLVEAMDARGESTVTLHGIRTVAPYAAYVNGTFGHSAQHDDSHRLAWHPGSCVVPTALAFAERNRRSGADVIAAVVAGTQVMALTGAVTTPAMQRVGWHGAKVLGVFGAAAAAGRLLGLTAAQLANALAVAASDASGTMEYDRSGGEVKRLHPGAAARAGAQGALLAQAGLTGPLTIFEGPRGIFRLFGGTDDLSAVDAGWDHFHILDTIFRLYPVVGTIHSPLDAIVHLRDRYGVDRRDIEEIRVGLVEYAVSHGASITRPHDALSAQFSLAFSVGLLLARGAIRPQDYFDEALWSAPDILAASDLVTPYATTFDTNTPDLSAQVEIRLRDGRCVRRLERGFRGHPANPVSVEDLQAKFRENVAGLLTDDAATLVIETIAKLDTVPDVTELTRLLVGS